MIEKEIKISVIICAYNAERFIREALESVMSQNIPEVWREIIVVDDGSADQTGKILQTEYAGRIWYIYQKNRGHTGALNTALANARGKYVCFLDADDYWHENKLCKVLALFESDATIDVVYNYLRLVDEYGRVLGFQPVENNANPDYLSERHLSEFLAGRAPFNPPTSGVSVRRSCLKQIGRLPEDLRFPDVIINHIIPFYAKRIVFIREYLHSYRLHVANSWVNKPLSIATLKRDINTYTFLHKLVRLHAWETGHDAKQYLARITRDINLLQLKRLKLEEVYFSAIWLSLTKDFPESHLYGRRLTHRLYARVKLVVYALVSENFYGRLREYYAKTKTNNLLRFYKARSLKLPT